MAYKVFIDGEAGTTGLQVRDRLLVHPDIDLVQIDEDHRKDKQTRLEAMAEADLTILCLPDDAAIEAVSMASYLNAKIIDASTAHRVHPDWTYGFAELWHGQRQIIQKSQRVANVGCYATAMIALIRPLIDGGVLAPDTPLPIAAVSGYTGGGKALINYMDEGAGTKHFSYALDLKHKHIPEVMHHSGLETKPIFLPMVGDFPCGMLVQISLFARDIKGGRAAIHAAYEKHYAKEAFIDVHSLDDHSGLTDLGYLAVDGLAGGNKLDIHILGDDEQMVLVARLDNLGKGASGAAVQNLNLMLGLIETTSLLESKK